MDTDSRYRIDTLLNPSPPLQAAILGETIETRTAFQNLHTCSQESQQEPPLPHIATAETKELRRARRACERCRKRKIKCDKTAYEEQRVCTNCVRTGSDCVMNPGDPLNWVQIAFPPFIMQRVL